MNPLYHHVHFHFHFQASISSSSVFWNPLTVINENRSRRLKQIEMTMSVPAPARDRVIDFGKYKGRMLGTLPSGYLKWVSRNLRARDLEEWAKLADQVLADPIYRDRIEWEFAENVLNGNQLNFNSLSCSRPTAVSELMEISERFGWDNQDKLGWAKVDFDLLGTSKCGRIPRLVVETPTQSRLKQKQAVLSESEESVSDQQGPSARTRRMVRRERQKMMRLRREEEEEEADWKNNNINMEEDDDEMKQNVIGNPFPGRQALLQKAINRRRKFFS